MESAPKYPNALSRELMEGGYTFLHRVFRNNFETKEPVVMNTGEMYLQYSFTPEDKTFMDGITILEGNKDSETWKLVSQVMGSFNLDQAFTENGINRPLE